MFVVHDEVSAFQVINVVIQVIISPRANNQTRNITRVCNGNLALDGTYTKYISEIQVKVI